MAGDDDVGAVRRLLAGAGLLPAGAAITLAPLTGGVSCDVWRVDADGVPLCVVKRALAQLRVAAEWFAPLERTESEVRWLDHARASVPHLCPAILAHDAAEHIFAMAYLPVDDQPVWKAELFASRVDPAFAAMVGRYSSVSSEETFSRSPAAFRMSRSYRPMKPASGPFGWALMRSRLAL